MTFQKHSRVNCGIVTCGRKRRALLRFGVLVIPALLVGCRSTGFLITPAPPPVGLYERELSSDSFFALDKLALIPVDGLISDTPSRGFLSEGDNPVSLFLERLDKAKRDARVKAVLLRINSPGGTVAASELMHDEIMHFRESGKPVVAVMMDTAASGAYYIACACDAIVAQPSTVTGSIGVIMQTFDVTGTMRLIGLQTDAITSGAYKDAGSPLRAMRPEERRVFQHIVDDMYDRFVKVVASGRPGLDEDKVRELADGRVYTAAQALELGLVDRLATLREAVEFVKEKAGVKAARLVSYHRPLDVPANYYATAPPLAPARSMNLSPGAMFGALTPRFLYLWAPGLPSFGS